MAVHGNDSARFENQPVLLNNKSIANRATFDLAPETKLLNLAYNIDDFGEGVSQEEASEAFETAENEYESKVAIRELFMDFFESIRPFVEKKIQADLVIKNKESIANAETKQQMVEINEAKEQSKAQQKNSEVSKPDIPDELFNEDGTLKNKFDELEVNKEELEKEGVIIGKRYGEGYVEIDKDGDGKYDQKAKYNESGKKIEEEIDTNGDGKLDTMVGYDENGKVIWKMADTDFDGKLDLSEDYTE